MTSPAYSESRYVEGRYTRSDTVLQINVTEVGNDTVSLSLSVAVALALSIDEPTHDTPDVVIANQISGSLLVYEVGNDTAEITLNNIVGVSFDLTEVGDDTAALTLNNIVGVSFDLTEPTSDTAAIALSAPLLVSVDATESASDTAAITLNNIVEISFAVAELGADTASVSLNAPVQVTVNATEPTSDTSSTFVQVHTSIASFSLHEQGNDLADIVLWQDPPIQVIIEFTGAMEDAELLDAARTESQAYQIRWDGELVRWDDEQAEWVTESFGFFPSVLEGSHWEAVVTFLYTNKAVLTQFPPGLTVEHLSDTQIRISGAYEGIFENQYTYRTAPGEFKKVSTSSADPEWVVVQWHTPIDDGDSEIETSFVFAVDGWSQNKTITIPHGVHWDADLAIDNFDEVIRRAA